MAEQDDADLAALRGDIDSVDEQLIATLAARFHLTRQVGRTKARLNLPSIDAERERAVEKRVRQMGVSASLSSDMVTSIYRLILNRVAEEHDEARTSGA